MRSKRVVGAVVLGIVQVAVLVSLALAGVADEPHGAPIRVVAPPVIATVAVERANSLVDRPVEARALKSEAEARRSVMRGQSVAAVVVDLSSDIDTIYVAGANGSRLNRAVVDEIAEFERSFGRVAVVRDVAPARGDDADARGVYLLVAASVVLGFVGPVVITWLRGPVARTSRRGVLRLAIAAGASLAVGLVMATIAAAFYGDGFVSWWVVSALTVLAIATATMALESVLGAVGIGVSTTLFVLTGAPLARLVHPLMLPEPWSMITSWLPHGAAIEAGRSQAYFGGMTVRPVLILVVWSLVSILTLAVARYERATEPVPTATTSD